MQIYPAKFLFLILFQISFALTAQKLPVDIISNKIHFAEEVLVKDAPHTDLYNRAITWLKRVEKDKAVLVKADPVNGLLVINFLTDISAQHEEITATFKIGYTMQIGVTDDKYWYSVYDFKGQELPKPSKLNKDLNMPKNKSLESILYSENRQAQEKEFYKILESAVHKHVIADIDNLKVNLL